MAGRKRRKMKLLAATAPNNGGGSTEEREGADEQNSLFCVPVEILEQILSRLNLKENIRASAVCKKWLAASISVRVANKAPWLMFFPKFGDLVEFYDPSVRQTYSVELPELRGSRLCYAKDGWLLLYKPRTLRVFFFNPYTKNVINLPRLELTYQIVAFSEAPTSPDCIVFTVKHISPTLVAISTCQPGATEWTTANYQNRLPFVSSIWNKLVFCNGVAYRIPSIMIDTTRGSSVMIGENKILSRAFGLIHRRTFRSLPEKICGQRASNARSDLQTTSSTCCRVVR
ncbi:hypothetical protein K7X08_014175 [Anisodus acutangulus]|uniref:F-box domain-containing protein n=1 Tax=Anisodus acutangulus TaxID=402998 RepID=A0A9Q1LLB0_9SOLA|nr:hypothetical protein K7X08_014175 [Anisodus acutangulus]